MRFRVKNDFIYRGKRKRKGTILNVATDLIAKLREANVIEEPIKDFGTEEAITNPKETSIKE